MLAGRLAAAFGGVLAGEAARRYVDARAARGLAGPLGADDVEPIARAQVACEDAAARRATRLRCPLVVRDTDLVSTVVYARHHRGGCPGWVVRAARERRASLYLLCDVDVPWVADEGQRDPEGAHPAARAALFDAFASALGELGCAHAVVRGGWDERARAAEEAVRALLAAPVGAEPPRVRRGGAP